jgi:hypothetical protein
MTRANKLIIAKEEKCWGNCRSRGRKRAFSTRGEHVEEATYDECDEGCSWYPSTGNSKEDFPPVANEVSHQAESSGGPLGTALSEIYRLIADVVPEKNTEVTIAHEPSASKGKRNEEASLEDKIFDLWHLGGQQLSEEDISELKEFVVSGVYQPRSVLFGCIDEEILGCIRDRAGAKIVSTLSKSIGFPKLERDISNYRRQQITGSLFYSNFKVWFSTISPSSG